MRDPTFSDFVGGSLPTLSRYAYALTGSRHAGQDLVQDTLIKLGGAWRRIERDGNPLGYARTIMFRTYVSRWRALRRRPADTEYAEVASTDGGYASVDMRDELRRALRELPRLQRAVLVLSYLDDLPDDSIAELLGRQPSTVRSLRRRGLIALRAKVSDAEIVEVSHGDR